MLAEAPPKRTAVAESCDRRAVKRQRTIGTSNVGVSNHSNPLTAQWATTHGANTASSSR
jgi:hypothetical protein